MTTPRPAGTTPRGLPYPGSDGIHSGTPAAIQALAEAIESQMLMLPNGWVLDFFNANVAVNASGVFYMSESSTTSGGVFVNLKSLSGFIGVYSWASGGAQYWGWATCGSGYGYMITPLWGNGPDVHQIANTTVGISAVGWGPPK